jgi:hypothetical protein
LADSDIGDDYSLSPPHERALARSLGWQLGDGLLPWAAWQLRCDGEDPGGQAWAELTPCHWEVGMEYITMADPQALQLDEIESRALMAAMQPYFEEDGIALRYLAPTRWLARSALFENLASASLDRVIGRNIDRWMPAAAQAAPLRRLQNEMQMLLYNHVINDQRAAHGQATVNSFWFSGCGCLPGATAPLASEALQPAGLRSAALREDWPAYAQAWQDIDAGHCAALLAQAARGLPAMLTLCGERSAQRYEAQAQTWYRRMTAGWRAVPVAKQLERL